MAQPILSDSQIAADVAAFETATSPANSSSADAITASSASADAKSTTGFIAADGTHKSLMYPLTIGISVGASVLVLLALVGLGVWVQTRRHYRPRSGSLPRGRQPTMTAIAGWPHGIVVEGPTRPPRGYARLGTEVAERSVSSEVRRLEDDGWEHSRHQPNSRVRRGRASSFVEHLDDESTNDVPKDQGLVRSSLDRGAGSEWQSGASGLLKPEPSATPLWHAR